MAEMDLGVPWATAMDHLVERTEVASLHRLVGALSRSNRLGTSVRATLLSELRAVSAAMGNPMLADREFSA